MTNLQQLIQQAYLEKDKSKLEAYKMLKTELDKNSKSTEPKTHVQVLVSLIKRYEQSIEIYKKAMVLALVELERAQLDHLRALLPASDPREVESHIYELIKMHGASLKNTKKITELAQQRYPQVDGGLVSHLIKSL